MKTKKAVLTSLECINENLNALILNQERTYFEIKEILKKMDQSENKRRVTVTVRRKKYNFPSLPFRWGGSFILCFDLHLDLHNQFKTRYLLLFSAHSTKKNRTKQSTNGGLMRFFIGGPSGTRTPDRPVMSRLL